MRTLALALALALGGLDVRDAVFVDLDRNTVPDAVVVSSDTVAFFYW
jgi:hypothetical protein